MAGRSRRKFSPQFKAEAVQLVIQSDRPIVEVAGELGIIPGTLGNWVNKYREENPEPEKRRCQGVEATWGSPASSRANASVGVR